MTDIGNSILLGFEILPKTTATINGTVADVIFNISTHRDNKLLGGYEADNEAIVYVKTSDLTNPKSLKGKVMVMEGSSWRISTVNYGAVITNLRAISIDSK